MLNNDSPNKTNYCFQSSRKHKGQDTAIPVRYEMRGYNTLLGSHYDHYYLEYEWYSDESPDPNVFKIGKSKFRI